MKLVRVNENDTLDLIDVCDCHGNVHAVVPVAWHEIDDLIVALLRARSLVTSVPRGPLN